MSFWGFFKSLLGLGIGIPPEQLPAYFSGTMYPPTDMLDTLASKTEADRDTVFVVSAACCAIAIIGAFHRLPGLPKETTETIFSRSIDDWVALYRDKNETQFAAGDLRRKILDAWAHITSELRANTPPGKPLSAELAATEAAKLINNPPDDHVVAAFYFLIREKCESAYGTLNVFRRNRIM